MSEESHALHDDESLRSDVRLSLTSGVGPRIRKLLMDRFGSSANVFAAASSELRQVPGVGPKLVAKIKNAEEQIDVDEELAFCRSRGVKIITQSHPDYPHALEEIDDPPGLLYVRGELSPQDAVAVAIVGSRHGTNYGLRQAERLAREIARAGITVASGLARGIDSAAHRGALAVGGRTLAVLGGGVCNIYPPEHDKLADEVAASGAVISESPPRAAPLAGAFPQRNRIISGMSLGVIVVEAAHRSGALITARLATEQNREVFAVPGRVDSRMSRGCHQLIRDGAKLVESVDDVLEELGPLAQPAEREDGGEIRHPAELTLNEVELQVLDAIAAEPTSFDQIVSSTGLAISQVLATASVLEMRRLIRRVSGVLVERI